MFNKSCKPNDFSSLKSCFNKQLNIQKTNCNSFIYITYGKKKKKLNNIDKNKIKKMGLANKINKFIYYINTQTWYIISKIKL